MKTLSILVRALAYALAVTTTAAHSAEFRAAEEIKATAKPSVEIQRHTLQVPSQGRAGGAPTNAPVLSYTYAAGPQLDRPVVPIRIGDVAIVGVQPELGSSLSALIRAQLPFTHTMVDSESYDHFIPASKSFSGR